MTLRRWRRRSVASVDLERAQGSLRLALELLPDPSRQRRIATVAARLVRRAQEIEDIDTERNPR